MIYLSFIRENLSFLGQCFLKMFLPNVVNKKLSDPLKMVHARQLTCQTFFVWDNHNNHNIFQVSGRCGQDSLPSCLVALQPTLHYAQLCFYHHAYSYHETYSQLPSSTAPNLIATIQSHQILNHVNHHCMLSLLKNSKIYKLTDKHMLRACRSAIFENKFENVCKSLNILTQILFFNTLFSFPNDPLI